MPPRERGGWTSSTRADEDEPPDGPPGSYGAFIATTTISLCFVTGLLVLLSLSGHTATRMAPPKQQQARQVAADPLAVFTRRHADLAN